MDARTRSFLKSNFGRYYKEAASPEASLSVTTRDAAIPEVPDVASREFGTIGLDAPFPDDVVMRRHTAYSDMETLREQLAQHPPAHAYYSAAHYGEPRNRSMNDKDWRGSDLIFDLDMDHLRDPPNSFPAMLDAVRDETLRLVEEFVLGDLDVPRSDVDIVFSGGRGYHVHVRTGSYRGLGGRERREIVDYVKGELDPEMYLRRDGTGGLKVPTPDEPGWGGRLNGSLVELIDRLHGEDPDRLEDLLERHGVDANVGEKTFENLLSLTGSKVERGYFDPPKVSREILNALVLESAHRAGAEIDEPVTSDTHRLIRLPGSLHGGSGLRVTPLTLEGLRGFDPLTDAVAFNDDTVLVEGTGGPPAQLRGERFEAPEGEEVEVPRYAAVFMALRGGAAVK